MKRQIFITCRPPHQRALVIYGSASIPGVGEEVASGQLDDNGILIGNNVTSSTSSGLLIVPSGGSATNFTVFQKINSSTTSNGNNSNTPLDELTTNNNSGINSNSNNNNSNNNKFKNATMPANSPVSPSTNSTSSQIDLCPVVPPNLGKLATFSLFLILETFESHYIFLNCFSDIF